MSDTGIPLALAVLTRAAFIVTKKQKFFQEKFLPFIAPLSLVALLFVTLIIFAAQGENVRPLPRSPSLPGLTKMDR